VEEKHKEQVETANPEPAPEPQRRIGLSWLTWPFVVLAAYVLSVGPVVRISVSYGMPGKHPRIAEAIDTIYRPIMRLAASCPPAERVFVWYLKVWRVPL
jgi:hypothetical protein